MMNSAPKGGEGDVYFIKKDLAIGIEKCNFGNRRHKPTLDFLCSLFVDNLCKFATHNLWRKFIFTLKKGGVLM